MSTLDLARQFIDAVEAGDADAARAVLAPNAGIWHNFDQITQTVDENMSLMAWMKGKAQSRHYDIKRLEEIKGGYLQQHVLRMVNQAGEKIEMPACVIATVADGKIQRIEEYLDPAPAQKLRSGG